MRIGTRSHPLRLVAIAFLSVLLPACGGSSGGGSPGPSGPTITSVLPAEVDTGDAIIVTGTGFGATQGTSLLTIAGTAAIIVSWSDTQIQATVPAGAQTGPVLVVLPGGPSSAGFLVVLWGNKNPQNVAVCTAMQEQWNPGIIPDGSGGAIIVWDDNRTGGGNRDIYAQRVGPTGIPLWTPNGIPICVVADHQTIPRIVPDGAGGAVIVWNDSRVAPSGGDFYAQRIDGSGTALWAAGGVNVCNALGSQTLSAVSSDGAGGALLVWTNAGGGGTGENVFGQRVDASGTPLWTSQGVEVSAAMGNEFLPQVVSDGSGGAIFVWEDYRGPDANIYAQRLNASGVPQWTANGVPVCAAVDRQGRPRLVPDGSGGAIIVWQDLRVNGTFSDLYMQRVDGSGNFLWAVDGAILSAAANFQGQHEMISDGAGGVIVAWEDDRTMMFSTDIYGQRVNGSGTLLWGANDVALSTASGTQNRVAFAPAGMGGAVIAWSSSIDLYAQRVDAAGAVLWTINGVPVSTATGIQEKHAIASDGYGGAVVVWEDTRNGLTDIFAQGISPGGQ